MVQRQKKRKAQRHKGTEFYIKRFIINILSSLLPLKNIIPLNPRKKNFEKNKKKYLTKYI